MTGPHTKARPSIAVSAPCPLEIAAKREAAGLTQLEAGALIYAHRRTYQDWEYGKRRMPPLVWEYFCLLIDYPEVVAARFSWLMRIP